MKKRMIRLLLVGLCVLNFGLALEYIIFWVSAAQADLFWRSDFTALYTAGSFFDLGLGKDLYNFDLQSKIQIQILAGKSFENGLLPNDYPPHTALFFAPLARLPLKTAFMTWEALQVILLVVVLIYLWKITAHWQISERVCMTSMVLGLPPLFFSFTGGGLSLFLLAVTIFFYRSLRSSKQIRAGLWLAIGSLKPQIIFLFFFSLLNKRWFKAVLAALAGGAVILGATMILLKWNIWFEFLRILLQVNATTGAYGIHPEIMYSLKGF